MQRFEVAIGDLKARIERLRGRALIEDGLAKELQQQFVQQAHVHHRAVVALHQLFDREREGGILVAEDARELHLVIEQQSILAPPGDAVQRKAHAPEEGLRALQAAQLGRCQEALGRELIERLDAEVPLGHPGDRLDVAQAAGARLHVGLEVVRRIVGLGVPLVLLAYFGFEEVLHRPEVLR